MNLIPLWLALSALASGQEDEVRAVRVLVVDFIPDDAASLSDARTLHDAVEAALRDEHLVGSMDDVPSFGEHDAHVYALACPTGQYVDCAYVLGARAEAGWVVGAELLHDDGDRRVLSVSVLDIPRGLIRLQVDLTWDGTNTAPLARGIGDIFRAVVTGATDTIDLRVDPDAGVDEAQLDPTALQAAADELGGLDREEGEVVRTDARRVARRRVTRADLAQWEGREDPPWAQVGLGEDSWRRWQNSGATLADWKSRRRGRLGELLVGATVLTLAQGPWTQVYEGWYAIDAVNLELSDQFVMQDQARGLRKAWELTVGAGVTPWLDLSVYGGPVVGGFRYRVQRVVEGEEPRPVEPSEKTVQSWIVGGRVTFAPMPTFPARPTLAAGAEAWFGTRQDKTLEVPEGLVSLPRNRMVTLQISPGVEVNAGRWLLLWARADVGIPVAGRVAQESLAGGALLVGRPSASAADDGVSIGAALGATVRLRIKPKWHPGE